MLNNLFFLIVAAIACTPLPRLLYHRITSSTNGAAIALGTVMEYALPVAGCCSPSAPWWATPTTPSSTTSSNRKEPAPCGHAKQYKRGSRGKAAVFFLALAAFAIFSLLLPLRPTTSVAERRGPGEVPRIYRPVPGGRQLHLRHRLLVADTFPLRDAFFQLNSWVKSLYGIRTVEVVGEVQTGDEIPDAPYLGE